MKRRKLHAPSSVKMMCKINKFLPQWQDYPSPKLPIYYNLNTK